MANEKAYNLADVILTGNHFYCKIQYMYKRENPI